MTSSKRSRLAGFLRSVLSWLSDLVSRNSSGKKTPIEQPNLNVSRVIRMLRNEEGVRHQPYRDHLGYETIGVGHLVDPRKGGSLPGWALDELHQNGRLSDASVDRLLEDDIINVVNQLETQLPWVSSLDQVRYTVLLDMAFQMGISGLLGFENTLRHVREGNYEQAADNMRQSLWYRQTPNRAERRINEMRTGVFHEYV